MSPIRAPALERLETSIKFLSFPFLSFPLCDYFVVYPIEVSSSPGHFGGDGHASGKEQPLSNVEGSNGYQPTKEKEPIQPLSLSSSSDGFWPSHDMSGESPRRKSTNGAFMLPSSGTSIRGSRSRRNHGKFMLLLLLSGFRCIEDLSLHSFKVGVFLNRGV